MFYRSTGQVTTVRVTFCTFQNSSVPSTNLLTMFKVLFCFDYYTLLGCFTSIHLFSSVHVYSTCMPWHACRSQKTACRHELFPSWCGFMDGIQVTRPGRQQLDQLPLIIIHRTHPSNLSLYHINMNYHYILYQLNFKIRNS